MKGEDFTHLRLHQHQFQRHGDQMGSWTSRWMPGKRRENVVQKMLVDPGSMVDDSMPEVRREAEALGADAVALAEVFVAHSD